MKIRRKNITAASTNDYIYVIMDNGDPIAKGTYDAMMKKQYSYNRPVDVMKFPKAELNSLIKMAKEAHISNPLKFAVNRYINDNNSKKKADSLNSSCTKKSVKASVGDSVELTFICPDLETGRSVVDKAQEIGGFGSTWNETKWVYIDVPSSQSVDNVDDLIQYAQSVGVFLNRPSAKLLDAWADSKSDLVLRGSTELSIKSNKINKRRAIKASDFEFIMDEPEDDEDDYDSLAGYYSWDDLTDDQRDYVISHWGDFSSFADSMYEWFNDYIMDMYYQDKEMLADEYNEKYGFNIDTDKISWSSNSQGPYADSWWSNKEILGKVWLATAGNLSDVDVSFDGIYDVDTYADYYVGTGDDKHIEYDIGVDELADYGANEEAISIIRNLANGAQKFLDELWKLIHYTCTAYPDDEWVAEALDGNPNSFTFIVDDNGEVEDIT